MRLLKFTSCMAPSMNPACRASAIDSTVLEFELQCSPEIGSLLRTIGALGPSPMPPWVASSIVPANLRHRVRRTLLDMHADPEGAEILNAIGIAAFVRVRDRTYDPIRRMEALGATVAL